MLVLCTIASPRKRLVGRLASSIVKIFPFPLSTPPPLNLITLVRPSLLHFLSASLESHVPRQAGVGDVMDGGAGLCRLAAGVGEPLPRWGVYVTRKRGNVYVTVGVGVGGYSRYPAKASCWPPG